MLLCHYIKDQNWQFVLILQYINRSKSLGIGEIFALYYGLNVDLYRFNSMSY